MLISYRSVYKHGRNGQCLFLIDWFKENADPLKQQCEMEPNLTVSIYIKSFIKIAYFLPICKQIWPPWEILFSDWLIQRKISDTTKHNGIDRKPLYKVFCTDDSFLQILKKTWLSLVILVSDWPVFTKILKAETARPKT